MGLTRQELWSRIGMLKEIDPLTDAAYAFKAKLERERPRQGTDHAQVWHVSFHGSQFPGDSDVACGRAALYTMMDFVQPERKRWLSQIAEAGKALENSIVESWYMSGFLVSAPAHLPWIDQDQFIDRKHWLTSTVDSIVCWPREWEPLVCEIKSKDAEIVEAMRNLTRGPDPRHVFQLKTQIGLAHEAGPIIVTRCMNTGRFAVELGKGVVACPLHGTQKCLEQVTLPPPRRGYIYYVSRENPIDTFEFMFEYDPAFMAAGRKRLATWREAFEDDKLPATNFEDKRFSHPYGWTWGASKKMPNSPCTFCDWGEICREDHRTAVERGGRIAITESAGVGETQRVRPGYDPERVRESVQNFWNPKSRAVA
jgi:hypothetical protein